MAYDIHEALERLENNLRNVDSARKQVESVVASNKDLQSVFNQYSKSFAEINDELSAWINQVQEFNKNMSGGYSDTIAKFNDACTSTSEKFNKDVAGSLESLGKETKKLSDFVSKLSQLQSATTAASTQITEVKNKLNDIAEEINASQKGQDEVLAKIKGAMNDIKSNQGAIKGAVADNKKAIDALDGKCDAISNGLGQKINTVMTAINSKHDVLCKGLDETKAKLNPIKVMLVVSILLSIVSIVANFLKG